MRSYASRAAVVSFISAAATREAEMRERIQHRRRDLSAMIEDALELAAAAWPFFSCRYA